MKVILFDLGNTLIENVSINLVNGFVSLFGNILSKQELEEEIKMVAKRFNERSDRELMILDLIRDIADRHNIDLGENVETRFLDAVEVDRSIDGVNEVLRFLKKQGYYLGVISNTIFSGKAMRQRLIVLGYDDAFNFVLTSADVTYRKPFKEIFERALSMVQKDLPEIKPEDVYFVGDSYEIDVLGSTKAGLKPIWLNVENEKQNYNGLMIHKMYELQELINKNMIK